MSQEKYAAYFKDPPVFIDIRTLVGDVKTLQFSDVIEIDGEKGHLCRDKQSENIYMVSVESVETIVTGFGQANFFNPE